MSMGCTSYPEIETRLQQGIDHPIAPRYVESTPAKQVIRLGQRCRPVQPADPDVLDLRRRADDHRRHHHRQRPRVRPELRHLPLHGQGKKPDRHRHRHAEQHAAVRAARLRGGPPLPDLDFDRQPPVRKPGLRLPRAAGHRRDGHRRRHPRCCRSSSHDARPSTCRALPIPKSCSKARSCRPAGPSPKAASANSPA